MQLFEMREVTSRDDPAFRDDTDMRRLAIPQKDKSGAGPSAGIASPPLGLAVPTGGKANPPGGCFGFTRCSSQSSLSLIFPPAVT
jgi:hypothetical protein